MKRRSSLKRGGTDLLRPSGLEGIVEGECDALEIEGVDGAVGIASGWKMYMFLGGRLSARPLVGTPSQGSPVPRAPFLVRVPSDTLREVTTPVRLRCDFDRFQS